MTELSVPGVSNTSVIIYATKNKPQIQVRRPVDQKRLYYDTTDAWFKDFLKLFTSISDRVFLDANTRSQPPIAAAIGSPHRLLTRCASYISRMTTFRIGASLSKK